MARVFLISEQTVKKNSVINNNVDGLYLLPAIEYAQDAGLQPLLGSKLYNKLMDLVENSEITNPVNANYKLLLDEYIQPYLINKVTAEIQLPLAYKLRNQGVVQQTGENTYVPSLKDVQYVIQDYENKANFYGNRMSDYLHANISKYPEYCSVDSCADMPSNKNAYNTSIYLG
jgi:hypothetical protein